MDMQKIPCFIYQEGVHFTLPPEIAAPRRHLCEFAVAERHGSPQPAPEVFRPVERPEDASVFLFPWDIGQYIDSGNIEAITAVIASLPYFAGRERRHLVVDYADRPTPLPLPACLFKVSLLRSDATNAVPTWYRLPEHSLKARPSFDWRQVRYQLSFVGSYSNEVRRAAVLSIQKQAPELKFFLSVSQGFAVSDGKMIVKSADPMSQAERQEIFLKSMRESLLALCPPGVGPQSIRLYETMLMGRIPVLFGDNVQYPLEKEAAYDAFCLRVSTDELLDTGNIIREFLRSHSEEELRDKCVLACQTWNRLFARNKLRTLLEQAGKLYGLTF
ncbi:glycosyltransferase family 47 protein [Desulfovibrio sp. OttesenSCG-928-C06]|nr:glycosyltransferase family 47 protein [Desulfovibrio sp. OttesenSCG-928-C06]